MKMFQSPTKIAKILPLGEHPEFRPESEKLTALRAQKDAWKSELRTIELKLAEVAEGGAAAQIDRLAAAALAGEPLDETETPPHLAIRAAHLRALIAGHEQAIRIQAGIIAGLRAELSVGPANHLLPAHKLAVGAIVDALEAVRAAAAHEAEIRKSLVDAGYDNRLNDFTPPNKIRPEQGWQVDPWEQRARSYAQ